MKRTENLVKTAALLIVMLWTTICGSTALPQARPLKQGKIVAGGTTYNVVASNKYSYIYIDDYSAYDKKRALINPEPGTVKISEDFILVNTDKLQEIKRRFYLQNVRMDIRVILTKNGKLIGMDYVLPKSPMITEQQFRTLDAQVRKNLKISIVFPNEWVKNQKYDGYATKYVILR